MLYVFDLDDTLYLERDYVKSGFKAVQKWLDEEKYHIDFFDIALDLFRSGVRNKTFNLVLEKINLELEDNLKLKLIEKMVDIYRRHLPDIQFCDDVMEFMEQIRNKNDMALITDGNKHSQWSKINSLGIERIIEKIFVTDDWGREFWKPHHRAFVIAQNARFSEECICIGDNPHKDFIAPKELGWQQSIRIKRESSLYEEVATPDYCREIISLSEL